MFITYSVTSCGLQYYKDSPFYNILSLISSHPSHRSLSNMAEVIGDHSTSPHNDGNISRSLESTTTISGKPLQVPSINDSEWNLASQLRVGDVLRISIKTSPLTYRNRLIRSSSNHEGWNPINLFLWHGNTFRSAV